MKILKKILSDILVLLIMLCNLQGVVVYANENDNADIIVTTEIKDEVLDLNNDELSLEEKSEDINLESMERVADIKAPDIDISSLKIDKTEVKSGEQINISLRANDDVSGIKYMWVWYKIPITGKSNAVNLTYNSTTDRYEGSIYIDDSVEEGLWKIDWIYGVDNSDNKVYIYNSNINTYGEIKEDLSAGNFNVTGTSADIKAPDIDISSLKIDKKEIKLGEQVNISLKASDDVSGIKNMWVWYKTPITGKSNAIILTYNSTTDRYEGNMYLDDSVEAGLWKIDWIYGKDNSDNEVYIYNSNINTYGEIRKDLTAGDFNVIGTSADIKVPDIDISSLKIDKNEVKSGEQVNISLKASDDISGIKNMWVWYKTPITGKSNAIILTYNSTTDRYEGSMYIDDYVEAGLWKIDWIYGKDNSDNEVYIYNSNINTYGKIREDLSAGDFNVVESNEDNSINPIEGATVITKNETWSNKTVNGDLYIGPEAVLTVNSNVIVTGNVYVLGTLKIYGGLTIKGTLYGTNMSWGGNPILYNGTIVMNGTNSISSMNMSNYPVQDIPVRIDTKPLVANNGKLNIKGVTLDLADMYIEGKKIELGYQGSFDISDLYIGNKDSVDIEFITVFGNKIKKSVKLDDHINQLSNDVVYKTHVQDYGWQDWVSNGELSGTSGQSKRLEAIEIKVENNIYKGSIEYRTHVQEYGWQDWVSNGSLSGTSGESKRLEAIEIRLTEEMAEKYDIYYRVHAQDYGWLGWAKNGESAGTEGLSKRLEAIEIKMVRKGDQAPGSTENSFIKQKPSVKYTTHVQNYGWQDSVSDGKMSGTSGEALRLEGIKIDLENKSYNGNIEYKTHVQDYGWQDWITNGSLSGTSGESKRLEAIEIKLTGEMAEKYDIYYRVHAQDYGWLGWAKNGQSAGTEGLSKRLEAIEIVLVEKGAQAPVSILNSFIRN